VSADRKTTALEIDRTRVLAYRILAQQLDRPADRRPENLAVLDLGVQDTPYGSARQSLAARTATPPEQGALALLWSTRGAPHLHRWADLPKLAAALWPLSDADATARIASAQIKEGMRLGMAAFTAAARAMREVVTSPMTRGEVSTAVSARIPESLTFQCKVCDARHISGGLFQHVGLPAGVRLATGSSPTLLVPLDDRPEIPTRPGDPAALVTAYLRLLGPATPSEVAKFLGTTQAEIRRAWPEGLTEVSVDGQRAWLPADRVEALRSASAPPMVRLLPPSDPYLQARDRDLLVPDSGRQKAVWRALAKPGALLVDGEIAGIWRARLAGRATLEVTVTEFDPLTARRRDAVHDEADRVAAARGTGGVRVRFETGG
jgi:hypothetical protein